MIDEHEFHRQESELRDLFHRCAEQPTPADPERVDRILERVRSESAAREAGAFASHRVGGLRAWASRLFSLFPVGRTARRRKDLDP